MANNPPNQSGKGTPNSLSDVGSQFTPSSITRALERTGHESQRYTQLTDRIGVIQENPIYQAVESYPSALSNPDIAKQYRALKESRDRAIRQQEIMEDSVRTRTIGTVGTAINQSFSSSTINGQVLGRLHTVAAQQESLRQASMTSPEILQNRLAASSSRLKGYATEASNIAANELVDVFGRVNPAKQARVNELFGLREQEINRRTSLAGAARIHSQQGLDPESRMDALVSSVGRARGVGESEGAYGSAQKLIEAFDQLSKATDTTTKEFKDLQKNVDKAQKEFSSGGGGGGNSISRLGNIAGGFNAAAGAVMQIGVNQRLGQAYNATGLADIENRKYQTYKAAMGGDVASLMQLSQFGGAEGFGGGLGTAAQLGVRAQQIAGYANVGMGTAKIASVIGAAGGVNDLMGGIASSTIADSDAERRVSANQARIAGINARLDVSRAINAVGAEQVQGFRDFGVGMGSAAMGMGGAGNAFLGRTVNDAGLGRMAASRISPEQMAAMAASGVAGMGSMFHENQIFAARGLESRGLGSMQENMQRMSALSGAGTNNPQMALAGVLEVALGKSLDSSKALNAVVEHTATMAASSTGRAYGIDTSAAAATLLTAGINKDTPNKEAALERSASIQDTLGRIGGNVGTDYAGMVNTARIGRTTGLSGVSSILAGKMDTATLMSLTAGSGADLQAMGIDVRGKNVGKVVDQLKEDRGMQLLEAGKLAVNYDRASVLKKLKRGEQLSSDEETGMNQAAGLQGLTGQELRSNVAALWTGINPNAPAGTQAMGAPATEGKDLRTQLDKLRTGGFEQLSTAAGTAASKLGGAASAVDKLTTAFEHFEKNMVNIEKNATTAAGRSAAGGKGMDIDGFNLAIGNLNTVLNSALKKSGLGSGSSGSVDNKSKSPAPHQ